MRADRPLASGPSVRRVLTGVVLFVGMITILSTPVVASIGSGNAEIGFDFGFTEIDSDTTDDSGTCVSVRGGYHFSELFELEGQLTSVTSYEFTDFDWDQDLTMTTLLVNAVFNFHPRENIMPYVLAGAGRVVADVDLAPFWGTRVDDDGVAFQAAAGARFFFGKRKKVAVRAEASVLRENSFHETSTHTSLVTGFTWRLGAAP